MAFCRHCGKEIVNDAVVCINCGRSLAQNKSSSVNDSDSFGWGVLGFFVPLAGLVLYLAWRDTKPKCAKAAGIGGLISTVGLFLLYVSLVISAMFCI